MMNIKKVPPLKTDDDDKGKGNTAVAWEYSFISKLKLAISLLSLAILTQASQNHYFFIEFIHIK